jgi:hypothetical protein
VKLSAFQEVIERIEDESIDLGRTIARANRAWQKAPTSPDQDMLVDSAALNLQAFYTGLERIFQQIARSIDEGLPTEDSWHVELLLQKAREIADVRPAILSPKSIAGLDEFCKFRHIVRNVYATNLDPEKMKNLVTIHPLLTSPILGEEQFPPLSGEVRVGSERLQNLFVILPDLWRQVRAELVAFAEFLRFVDAENSKLP